MDPISNVRFGTVGGVKEASRRWGYTPSEVTAGKDKLEYYLEGQEAITLNLDIYRSSGIKRFTGGVGIDSFTAISVAYEETMVGPHKVAADPREVPEFGRMMVISDYLMITHMTVKTSLTMRGALPAIWSSNKRGSVVGPYTWECAYGDFTLVSPEGFVGEVGTSEKITDLDESTVELHGTVANTDETAQAHMIELESGIEAYVGTLYQLSMNVSLSQDGNPEKSYTVTNFMTEREV